MHLLILWMLAGSLPEKLGSWVMLGERTVTRLCWTLTQILPGLAGKLGCMKGQMLVWSSRLELEEIFFFFKKGGLHS